MPTAFPRTGRSISTQPVVGTRALMVGATVVLGGWMIWFTRARVPVYETSDTARLEVLRATHPVDAPVEGRVIAVHYTLNSIVKEGDVLVELDTDALRMQLAEARARASGLGPQLTATKREASAEEGAVGAFRREAKTRVVQARSRLREGEIQAKQADDEAKRAERLFKAGSISEAEFRRLRADADRQAANVAALREETVRLERESATGVSDRRTRIASLQRDVARLEADLTGAAASVESIEHDIDRRVIRAPATGRVGEIGTVRTGSYLQEGERVATVVAEGDLRVVATFAPAAALGRIRPGQHARVRLQGFPWTEYGTIEASVTEVASEIRDEHARVELAVIPPTPPAIPLQHGLPGTVEVTVEQASPAGLLLRAAGRLVSSPPASTSTSTSSSTGAPSPTTTATTPAPGVP